MAAQYGQRSVLSVEAESDMLDGAGKYPFVAGDCKVLVADMACWNLGQNAGWDNLWIAMS